MINFLFLCSGDGARSGTAQQLFCGHVGVSVRAAQLGKVDRAALRRADVIVVMERHQRRMLERRFRWSLCAKRIFCLGIPDRFAYMEPALVQLLRERMVTMMPSLRLQAKLSADGHSILLAETIALQSGTPANDGQTPLQVLSFGSEGPRACRETT